MTAAANPAGADEVRLLLSGFKALGVDGVGIVTPDFISIRFDAPEVLLAWIRTRQSEAEPDERADEIAVARARADQRVAELHASSERERDRLVAEREAALDADIPWLLRRLGLTWSTLRTCRGGWLAAWLCHLRYYRDRTMIP